MSKTSTQAPTAAFTGALNLASVSLGAEVLHCSDDFFAESGKIIREEEAHFDPDAYYERGKVMDGWESRRRRVPGHDQLLLRLALPGTLRGADIDTRHFLGNHAPWASIEVCSCPSDDLEALRQAEWREVLSPSPLAAGSRNLFGLKAEGSCTHARLRIYPDGGVARLRLYGEPSVVEPPRERTDLAALTGGGRAVACSDAFFGVPHHLIWPGDPVNMGGGWETRRRRGPGHDWVIVELGWPGVLEEIAISTQHFKGNFPHHFTLEAICWPGASSVDLMSCPDWSQLIPETRMSADSWHRFRELGEARPWTHLRLNIHPCGGVARLRAWGRAQPELQSADPLLSWLQGLGEEALRSTLSRCCGAQRWVEAMIRAAPFTSRAHLFGVASRIWWSLEEADWLEAFSHHPRIGENVDALRERFGSTADWSEGEQAGVQGASEETLAGLAEGNRAYYDRYGFLFIVCASGLSAEEMLRRLKSRMRDRPEDEVRIAAAEQEKITRLRLEKLELT